jgi:hypothetical protein
MNFGQGYREINELRLTRNQVDWWSTVRSRRRVRPAVGRTRRCCLLAKMTSVILSSESRE